MKYEDMIYPLSYWKTGDLVVLQSSACGHYQVPDALRNYMFVYMHSHSYDIVKHSAAVLYCINDGTTVYMHARYLREPKKKSRLSARCEKW